MISTNRRHPLILGVALLTTLAVLTGCTTGAEDPERTATPTATADFSAASSLTLHPGDSELEWIVAHVMARHLTEQGIPTELAEATMEPWATVPEDGVAVVDTLRMAAATDPAEVTGPVPSPTAAPSPSEDASLSDGATPAPSATDTTTPTATADPSATASPGPVPAGEPAPDAGAVTALVREQLAAPLQIVGESNATLRLQVVTSQNIAGLGELQDLVDLNGQCDELSLAPVSWGELEAERLSVLAGCIPEELVDTGKRDPASALVAGEADLALLYGTDPAITQQALRPLEDADRILPEGRLAVLADPQALPENARRAMEEVLSRLDGTQLAELQQLVQGPDPLSPQNAAQYWLVQNGLEEAPEGWF